MNATSIIAILSTTLSLFTKFAPLVPHLVEDVEGVVGAAKKAIGHLSSLDVKSSVEDIAGAMDPVKDIGSTITQVLAASKHISVA